MKLGKFNVEIEYLDEEGNVYDSSDLFFTDDEDEAVKYAKSVELFNPNEQVSIWEWDDDEQVVVDSWVVKEYSE